MSVTVLYLGFRFFQDTVYNIKRSTVSVNKIDRSRFG